MSGTILTFVRGGSKRRSYYDVVRYHRRRVKSYSLTTTADPTGLVAAVWPEDARVLTTKTTLAHDPAAFEQHHDVMAARYARYETVATLEYGLSRLEAAVGRIAVNRALHREARATGRSLYTRHLSDADLHDWLVWMALALCATIKTRRQEEPRCHEPRNRTPKADRPSIPANAPAASSR